MKSSITAGRIVDEPHKLPKLLISKSDGFIVLATKLVSENTFAGVVVHNPLLLLLHPHYQEVWELKAFDTFNGRLELTND